MITVWGRINSTNVKKVRWCLQELAMNYQHIPAGGQYGITHDADYLAMNPNGLVPCLKDDAGELILWESNAIVRYLAARYGAGTLWQEAPAERAQGDKWMDWVASTVVGPFRGVFISLVRTPEEQRDARLIEESIRQCDALLAMLDAELANHRWLSGAQFGIGDIAVGPTVYALLNLDITWTDYPHLRRWYQQLSERPAFRDTVMIPLS
ncbi:glutathione S-transferase family protein [Entomohabitans teleogrylli]|uniref:glutathione S-transferase family protein n=1 Tax=Entomohabitans teleogrylli TaxID=1384589 RepID=UPI00073D5D4D|nr:glutathione S-transferase family protein [Entomohabitans teleogrylli]